MRPFLYFMEGISLISHQLLHSFAPSLSTDYTIMHRLAYRHIMNRTIAFVHKLFLIGIKWVSSQFDEQQSKRMIYKNGVSVFFNTERSLLREFTCLRLKGWTIHIVPFYP